MNFIKDLKKLQRWGSPILALLFCLSAFMVCSGSKNRDRAKNLSTGTSSPAEATETEAARSVEPEARKTGPSSEIAPEDPAQAAGELEDYFSAVEGALQRIPRETFDPEAVVQKIGQDPVKLFEWVRDETGLVVYQGSLRGPVGVLMDRCGNSLDRALFLYKLIELAGNEVRLAGGHLSPERAKEVYQKSGGNLARLRRLTEFSLADQKNVLEELAQEFQLPRADLLKLLAQARQDREKAVADVSKQVKDQTSALLEIIGNDQKAQPGKPSGREYEALTDHWWVQWEKDGEWLDLDPTLPSLQPGEKIAEAENTCGPEDLEEGLFHTITIRAIAEQWREGRLEEHALLQHLLVPSKLMGKPIVLRQLPVNWPSDQQLFSAGNPLESFRSAVLEQTQWKAALEIDGETVAESYLTAQGDVVDEPDESGSKKPKETGGLRGVFGGLAGAGEEEEKAEKRPATKGAHLTAEWLEFEIHSPGQPVQTIRREIFNLLGPSIRKNGTPAKLEIAKEQQARRNFRILGQTEFLPLVCRLSSPYVEAVAAENMLLHRDLFQRLLEEYRTLAPQDALAQVSEIRFLPGELYGLALKRFAFSAPAQDIYLSSPNLFAFHSSLGENEKGELIGFQGLDIISNEISVNPTAKEGPFRVRLEQGVLETLLEAREMSGQERVMNTALIFAEAKAQKINWLLIKNEADQNWKSIKLPPDVRARIEQDLSGGAWVIAPVQQVQIGGKAESAWWRLDPDTGNLLGLGGGGMGQAMTQYAVKVNIVLQLKTAIQIYADIMRCLATAITSPLRGVRPQHDELTLKCIWDVVCKNGHKAAKALLTIEVNWTNIIISQTISWLMGKFCAALWEGGIAK